VAGRTGSAYTVPGAQAYTVAAAQAYTVLGPQAWRTVWSLVAPVVVRLARAAVSADLVDLACLVDQGAVAPKDCDCQTQLAHTVSLRDVRPLWDHCGKAVSL
jgi:hypothetical protein